jgi:hypothetical protein
LTLPTKPTIARIAQATEAADVSESSVKSASDLVFGTVVDSKNANSFKQYLPRGAQFAIAHGFKIRIGAQRRIDGQMVSEKRPNSILRR